MGFKGVAVQFAFEQGVATGMSAGMCKETENQSKKECQQSAIKQENATLEGYTQSLVGIIGGELLEKYLKKAFAKQTAKVTAKQAGKVAGKQTGKAVAKTGGKIGAKMGIMVAKLANKLIAKISAKLAAKIAAKLAAKQAAMMATKFAAKAAMGPVGWALMVFDLISMGLDLWDPFGFNETFFNKDLRGMRDQFFDGYKDAIDNGTLPDSRKNIIRQHYYDIQKYEIEKAQKIKEAQAKGVTWVDDDPDSIAKKPFYEDVKKMTYSSIASMKNKDLPKSLDGPVVFPMPAKPAYPEYIAISADIMADWYKTYKLTDVYSDAWYNSATYKNWQDDIANATNKGIYIDRCLQASDRKENSVIQLSTCDATEPNQSFTYTNAGQYKLDSTEFCITKDANKLSLKKCEQTRPMIGATDDNPLEMVTNDYTQRWASSKDNQIFSLKKDDQLLYVTDDEYTPITVRPVPPAKSSCIQFDSVVGKKEDDTVNVSVAECNPTSTSQKFYLLGNQIQIEDNGSGVALPDEYKKLRELLIGFNMTQQQFEQTYTSQLLKDPTVRQMWKSEIETYINNLFTEERIDGIVNQVLTKHGLEDMADIFDDKDLTLDDKEAATAEDGENLGGGFVLATDEKTGCRYKYDVQTDKSEFLLGPDGKNQQVEKISAENKCPYCFDCVTGETKWGPQDGSEVWVDIQDPSGKTYYYNCTTQESSWFPKGIDPNLNTWVDGVDTSSKCEYRYNPSKDLTEIKKNPDGSDQIQILTNDDGCRYVYNCNTQESKWNTGEDQWVTVNNDPVYYLNCQSQETSWYPNGIEPPQPSLNNQQGPPPKTTVTPPRQVVIKPTATELSLPTPKETPPPTKPAVSPPVQPPPSNPTTLVPKEAIEVKKAELNFVPPVVVTTTGTKTKQEEAPESNNKLIIAGVVGGVLLIIIFIVVFMVMRSRNSAPKIIRGHKLIKTGQNTQHHQNLKPNPKSKPKIKHK